MDEKRFDHTPELRTYKIKSAVSLNPHLSPQGVIDSLVEKIADKFETDEAVVDIQEVSYRNLEAQSLITMKVGPIQTEDTREEIENDIDEALSASEALIKKQTSSTVVSTQP